MASGPLAELEVLLHAPSGEARTALGPALLSWQPLPGAGHNPVPVQATIPADQLSGSDAPLSGAATKKRKRHSASEGDQASEPPKGAGASTPGGGPSGTMAPGVARGLGPVANEPALETEAAFALLDEATPMEVSPEMAKFTSGPILPTVLPQSMGLVPSYAMLAAPQPVLSPDQAPPSAAALTSVGRVLPDEAMPLAGRQSEMPDQASPASSPDPLAQPSLASAGGQGCPTAKPGLPGEGPDQATPPCGPAQMREEAEASSARPMAAPSSVGALPERNNAPRTSPGQETARRLLMWVHPASLQDVLAALGKRVSATGISLVSRWPPKPYPQPCLVPSSFTGARIDPWVGLMTCHKRGGLNLSSCVEGWGAPPLQLFV